MPKFDTQPISDAHDKFFAQTLERLSGVRTTLEQAAGKLNERVATVPVIKSLTPATVNFGFTKLDKALTQQHDFVESLLAKTR